MFSDLEDDDGSVFSEEDFSDDDLDYAGEYYSDYDDWEGLPEGSSAVDDLFDSLRIADAAAAEEENGQVVQLEDGLWDSLPFELVDKILAWLPPAAHFRFRCVCKRWRSLLTSPEWLHHYAEAQPQPACSVMCAVGARAASFFCHSERKWFELPLDPINTLQLEWELVDTDVGLVCYQCNWNGRLYLCVCNPLTKTSKVIPPNYPSNSDVQPTNCELVKLHVDRKTKAFKLVVLVHSSNPPTTVLYDSTTSLWSACNNYPSHDFRAYSLFVWKNVIYTQCFEPQILLAFGMDSGLWSDVETDLPCHPMTKCFIVSHNDMVLLLQIDSVAEEPMSVWKLDDEASNFSRSSWIKVPLDVPSALRPLLGDFYSCVSQGDWIFFTTSHTNQWVKYSFATKSWRVMPCHGAKKDPYVWFDWEPRLDVNVESDPLQNYEQPVIETDLRWGM